MRASFRVLSLAGGLALVWCLVASGEVPAQVSSVSGVASVHLDDASLPDPSESPGDFSRDLSAADLCNTPIETFATVPPKASCDKAFEDARVPRDYRFQYACVFLVPPAIGGTQSHANIWLQPAVEAPLKASADMAARNRICKSPADLAEARRLLAIDWVDAYRKYLLPSDRLAPIDKLGRGPDDFGLPPHPASAEKAGGASFYGAVAYGDDLGYGYGDGSGYGEGNGADPDDRKHRPQRSLRDDRGHVDKRRAVERNGDAMSGDDRRARDRRAPWPHDGEARRRDAAGRGVDGRDNARAHPDMSAAGKRPDAERPDEGRGIRAHDGPRGPRDGRDIARLGGDRDGDHRPTGPREIDGRRPFADERSVDGPHRSPGFPPRGSDQSGFDSNHQYAQSEGRVSPSRDARAQDMRHSDIQPLGIEPNDVRPSRPGRGRPRYRGLMRHGGGRGGGHRR